ncbi:MAG: hypothetical protein D3909_02555 [Candidatus Electrothrix sp. ATG1]|nr:hypothetical protein [Candidatus Electrothrix sp. ATG1]
MRGKEHQSTCFLAYVSLVKRSSSFFGDDRHSRPRPHLAIMVQPLEPAVLLFAANGQVRKAGRSHPCFHCFFYGFNVTDSGYNIE